MSLRKRINSRLLPGAISVLAVSFAASAEAALVLNGEAPFAPIPSQNSLQEQITLQTDGGVSAPLVDLDDWECRRARAERLLTGSGSGMSQSVSPFVGSAPQVLAISNALCPLPDLLFSTPLPREAALSISPRAPSELLRPA